ncbi:MAG: Ig-like domain-containing protein, partial [Pirellulales bacterium]|nr:Ig-like domain-containing protein [Pirellulales bacterium]
MTVLGDIPAMPDQCTTDEDVALTVNAAAGVLANDGDNNSGSLTASLVDQPTSGTISFNADGSFTYTPNANFFGTDSFTYRATDSTNDSNVALVTINVTNVSDPPAAVDDDFTVPGDGGQQTFDVLANDTSDPDPTQALTLTSVTQGSGGGTVSIDGDRIRYTPSSGFVGNETFTYTITDSDGLTDTASVVVTVQNASGNSLSGFVYIDVSGDNNRSSGDAGVPGVLITLTGVDQAGGTVSRTMLTADDGSYRFDDLPPGTYTIAETQPLALVDGASVTTVSGGVVSGNQMSGLVLAGGQAFTDNNFAERTIASEFITVNWFFASAASSQENVLRETLAIAEQRAGNTALADAIRTGADDLTTPDNAAPIATGDSYATSQDETLSVAASSGVLSNDVDSSSDTLTATLVSSTTNGTL